MFGSIRFWDSFMNIILAGHLWMIIREVILPVAFVGAVNTLVSVYAAHSAGDMYLLLQGSWTTKVTLR